MNKVVTINLNGNAYQLEESGYEALREYLADAEAKLKNDPDLAEIMADLEQAIADKCNQHLSPNKNVVTKTEVDQILAEMGRVEAEPGEDAGEKSKASGSARPASGSGAAKRLYRIHEGSMIAGVCNGLAAYFNIDVTPIRLVWGVLAIVSAGFFILVYLLATFVIPSADTFEERAEAHGQPFNAQEVVDDAKRHYANFKQDAEQWWKNKGSHDWRNVQGNLRRETNRAARQARRAMRNAQWFACSPQIDHASHVLAMVLLPIFGIVVAALTVLWILAVISVVNTGAVFGWPIPIAVPLWVAILVLVMLYGAVVSPFKMAFQGRGYFHGGRYYGWPGIFGGLVWMACLVAAFTFAYTYVPEFHAFVENFSTWVVNRLGH